jgi:DDE superfamily endonuclease
MLENLPLNLKRIRVFLAYFKDNKRTLIDFRLYLPENWVEDKERCLKAKIPLEMMRFQTKHELGLEMIDDAINKGIPVSYVAMDGFYGENPALLTELEQGESYLLKSVVIGEYNGRFQAQLNKNSSVERLAEDIEVGGGDFIPTLREAELKNIVDLVGEQWVTLKVKVVQLWEDSHETIEQAGLIGNPTELLNSLTGPGRFSRMEEGKSYKLRKLFSMNMVVKSRFS